MGLTSYKSHRKSGELYRGSQEVEKNSDLQAGIWFGSVALSPIITFPHFTKVYLSLPKDVVFSAHMHMRNAT